VTLLDACGIGALVTERRRLTEGGGMLMLRAPVPLTRRVLGIVGLADWIVE
jgi:anti-anti-sigma regulatory factor